MANYQDFLGFAIRPSSSGYCGSRLAPQGKVSSYQGLHTVTGPERSSLAELPRHLLRPRLLIRRLRRQQRSLRRQRFPWAWLLQRRPWQRQRPISIRLPRLASKLWPRQRPSQRKLEAILPLTPAAKDQRKPQNERTCARCYRLVFIHALGDERHAFPPCARGENERQTFTRALAVLLGDTNEICIFD